MRIQFASLYDSWRYEIVGKGALYKQIHVKFRSGSLKVMDELNAKMGLEKTFFKHILFRLGLLDQNNNSEGLWSSPICRVSLLTNIVWVDHYHIMKKRTYANRAFNVAVKNINHDGLLKRWKEYIITIQNRIRFGNV